MNLYSTHRPSSADLTLRYSNVSEDAILLREQLEGYALSHGERFKIWNVLSTPAEAKEYTLDSGVRHCSRGWLTIVL